MGSARVFMTAVGRLVRVLLWAGVAVGVLLAAWSVRCYLADTSEIRARVGSSVDVAAPPSVRMRQALAFMTDHVPHAVPEGYYLIPLFEPLRPTPLQVMTRGGDCATRARAFIAILHGAGVAATKLAIYNAQGVPVHAVVRVTTERGLYVVDVLFDVIHEDEHGDPIPLPRLSDPAVLADSLRRAAEAGNSGARDYPLEEYGYHEVRTINWEKSAIMRAGFWVLATCIGEEGARRFPRPYLSEEPALMAACAGGVLSGVSLALLGVGLLWRRRRARRTGAASAAMDTPRP